MGYYTYSPSQRLHISPGCVSVGAFYDVYKNRPFINPSLRDDDHLRADTIAV